MVWNHEKEWRRRRRCERCKCLREKWGNENRYEELTGCEWKKGEAWPNAWGGVLQQRLPKCWVLLQFLLLLRLLLFSRSSHPLYQIFDTANTPPPPTPNQSLQKSVQDHRTETKLKSSSSTRTSPSHCYPSCRSFYLSILKHFPHTNTDSTPPIYSIYISTPPDSVFSTQLNQPSMFYL